MLHVLRTKRHVRLAALIQGEPLPTPAGEPHHVLVAPGVPGTWRPATRDQARAFAACEPASTLRSLPGVSPASVDDLWAQRAVIRSAPCSTHMR